MGTSMGSAMMPGGSGGDGGYDANGMMKVPGQQVPGRPRAPQAGQDQAQGQRPQWQTSRPPAPSQGAPPAPPPTFAQMQAAGQARPAPPQQSMQSSGAPQQGAPQSFGGQLQQSVSQALQNPSVGYGLPQVQQVRDALTQQLQQQFGAQQKQLDEEMARRGVGSSSIASGYQGDLAGQQANALAGMNAGLIQNAAQLGQLGQSSAMNAGNTLLGVQNAQQLGMGQLGVQQQQANTNQAGTYGQLGLGQGQLALQQQLGQAGLTGSLNGQDTLAARQQQLEAQQFGQQFGLAQQLGLGNLQLGQQGLAQQGQYQQGQLGLGQGQLDLSRQLGVGGLGLQQQQLQQSGNQFQQSLAAQQQQDAMQNQLAAGSLTGNYNGTPTAQTSQFQQSLAQQLGLAKLSDQTANRGIDAQSALANNQLLYQVLSALGGISPAELQAMFKNYQTSNPAGGTSGGTSGGTGGSTTGTAYPPGIAGTGGNGGGRIGDQDLLTQIQQQLQQPRAA